MHIQHDEHHWPDVHPTQAELDQSKHWVDPLIWAREDMRRALAERDIRTVYKLLQRFAYPNAASAHVPSSRKAKYPRSSPVGTSSRTTSWSASPTVSGFPVAGWDLRTT